MPKIIDDENVFRAAIEVLVRHGYENATTKAIAAQAGIHEATLFRKYGSKSDLINSAIQQQLSDTPFDKLSYSGTLQTDLLAILRAYVEVTTLHGEIIPLLFVEVARDPSLRKLLDILMQNIQSILDIVEQYQSRGLLRPEPALTTLYSLIGPIMIRNMAQRANPDLLLPEIDLEQHLAAFLYGHGVS